MIRTDVPDVRKQLAGLYPPALAAYSSSEQRYVTAVKLLQSAALQVTLTSDL